MNLKRLSQAAAIAMASLTGESGLWGQTTETIPIVSPQQVIARLQGMEDAATPQTVDRPQPIQLETFDFSAQIGAPQSAARNSSGVQVFPNSLPVPITTAAPATVHRAQPLSATLPASGRVERASFQPESSAPAYSETRRAGGIDLAQTPQDGGSAVEPMPAQPSTYQPSPASQIAQPVILPTAPDAVEPQVQVYSADNAHAACTFCGGAGCDHCGGQHGNSPYDLEQISSQFECCGFVSCARYYAIVDYLRWDYENTRIVAGNLGGVQGYDTSDGWRVTLGHRRDYNRGMELTYFGFGPWEAETVQTSAAGNLTAGLIPFGGFVPANLSAFANDTSLRQSEQVRLHSAEIMDTLWGWDVVKTSWGFRYIYFDEQLLLTATNNVAQVGIYDLEMTNFMFGPQLGLEMFYDIGYRLSFSFSTKIAGFLNFSRGDTLIVNNGATIIDATDRDTAWAASGDVGFYAHYQLLPRVRARVGYDVLALWQMATVAENYTPFIGPANGLEYSNSDEVFFHGVSAGIEIYR